MAYYKIAIVVFAFIFSITAQHVDAQCDQKYNWTVWQKFPGTNATGIINNDGQTVNVMMTANYSFTSTPQIFNYAAFNGFKGGLPNTTTPATTWSIGPQGNTTMCFDRTVQNPVLMMASIGAPNLAVTLKFSRPYKVVYDGGGNTFVNDTTLTGREGYVVIVFPGDFTCVSIYSSTYEYYTNISWGLNPPLFPVSVNGKVTDCEKATLTASGGVSYLWSGGNTPNSATNTFTKSGTYFLTVTDQNGCQVTTSRDVTINQKSYSTIDTTVCSGQSVFGHNISGTYTETLAAANGCDSVVTLKLTIRPPATTTIKQTICEGDSYLGYNAPGTYTDKFTSTTGCDSVRTLILTMNKKVFTSINYTICDGESFLGYKVAGIYKDVFTAQNGCDSTRTLNLTVNPRPTANAGADTAICFGDDVRLTASGGESYSWSPSTYLSNPNISNPVAGPEHTITYSVSVKDINGCTSNADQVTITVIQPQVSAGKDTAVMANQPVQLHASGQGNSTFVQYAWSPTIGLNDPNSQNPIASVNTNMTYVLTAYTADGCKATDTINIQVVKELKINMPNAFTPNGDGQNDIFRPLAVGIKSLGYFRIYNRWGDLIFSTSTIGQGWDGTSRGVPQNAGNYIWQINGIDFFGKSFSQQGSVILIR
jgi:gliding motility-associated-like protein